MKIIKRGTPQTEKTYTIDCVSCETKFSFKYSEARYMADSRDGDYLMVICPVCSKVGNVDVTLGR